MRKLGHLTILFAIFCAACLSGGQSEQGGQTINVYGFSIMKEALEKEIYPAFAANWKREYGQDVHFVSSFNGSEIITNQILQGAPADIAILAIERDVDRLIAAGHVSQEWRTPPQNGIIIKTPFVILTRQGNPKNIKDFPDLAKPGVRLIHPDPASSGGAKWSVLAIYGSELEKAKGEISGYTDALGAARATGTLQSIWANVISTPGSAREARTQFEAGHGDALITYELEGLLMKQMGQPIEIVVPPATIFSEHPVAAVDRNVTAAERPLIEAFRRYLWSKEAQKIFVKYHFRSAADETYNETNPQFSRIARPFTVELFGGWSRAYPEIIEGVFVNQVQKK